ncbi:RNA polymerase sigma factor [Chitinophaga niabensis]|uniref:RNA polymerase sigma-70 factor, ECF subfamily n=1 Tax=Chitinophaga niabensis TaxID=536979 RepID=A0A1N6JY83_9BACT|nr:sigma-70 family RNA polymerase sigma factor [Chitinophaga niabensis]SIO49280.1 RNA polymerase sigma-70 factor, ECF subfamily [Chitinophaga niabensis]
MRPMYKANEDYNTVFKEIYKKYYKDLFLIAVKFLRDEEDAKDAVQESFVALLRKPERLPEIEDLRFYLFTVLRNQCLSVLKKRKTAAAKEEDFLYYQNTDSVALELDIYGALDDEESKYTVEWFFSFLTPQRKRVVELVYLEERTYVEAATILGIKKESIKTHLRLAKIKLKGHRAKLITGLLIFVNCFSPFTL